jgi:hypothetical protein
MKQLSQKKLPQALQQCNPFFCVWPSQRCGGGGGGDGAAGGGDGVRSAGVKSEALLLNLAVNEACAA